MEDELMNPSPENNVFDRWTHDPDLPWIQVQQGFVCG